MAKRALIAAVLAALAVLADFLLRGAFQWKESIASATIGVILGLVLDVATDLRESLSRLEKVAERADARLALVTELPLLELGRPDTGHFEVLCRLIGDALKSVRVMANVDSVRYLGYLERALSISSMYEGVQRFPIRWFRQGAAPFYLDRLRGKSMERKVRLFVIDDGQVGQMHDDLEDKELLAFYWERTGTDVHSYWIGASELRAAGLPVVDDCALYDKRLLIEYDEARRVLSFSVGEDKQIKDASKLFSRIHKQERQEMPPFFREIPRHPRQVVAGLKERDVRLDAP
ncbi:MAG TPA: hypothetical protein VK745_21705 [Polyangiaceae bacterium]|jgi:hypothetical protein|nr:hypothetical protein [Polyangiaceae bacterium]